MPGPIIGAQPSHCTDCLVEVVLLDSRAVHYVAASKKPEPHPEREIRVTASKLVRSSRVEFVTKRSVDSRL